MTKSSTPKSKSNKSSQKSNKEIKEISQKGNTKATFCSRNAENPALNPPFDPESLLGDEEMKEISEFAAPLEQNEKSKKYNQYKHLFFTWWNYKPEDIVTLVKLLDDLCYSYAFQEERGEKSGKLHLQGVCSFKERHRSQELGLDNTIWWRRVRFLGRAYVYCTKERTREPGTRPYVKNYAPPEVLKVITDEQLYPWMIKLNTLIEQEPNNRIVWWIWDHRGSRGKSAFINYQASKRKIIRFDEGNKGDIMYHLKQSNVTAQTPIFIDIPRANGNHVSYKSLETIKNGYCFSNKYESGDFRFNPPHIFVFANTEPDWSKFSGDRYRVIEIYRDPTEEYDPTIHPPDAADKTFSKVYNTFRTGEQYTWVRIPEPEENQNKEVDLENN